MSVRPDRESQLSSFSKLEQVKREDSRRRFRATTAGERIEAALRLSKLAAEMRSGVRTKQ